MVTPPPSATPGVAPRRCPSRSRREASEWRDAESDVAYTAALDPHMPQGHIARAVIYESTLAAGVEPPQIRIFGERGVLAFEGDHGSEEVRRFDAERQLWEVVPPPEGLLATLPPVGDVVQRAWNLFFREFVPMCVAKAPPATRPSAMAGSRRRGSRLC